MKAFNGHFGGGFVRSFTYIAMHGPDGLKDIAQYAVLNANYLQARLRSTYTIPYDRICMHEFVAEGRFEGSDVRALDIAKRLMDYNFHPPTNYFPLIVHEALMIEPTETENKDTLDAFADALIKIAEEAKTQPELLHNAPHITPFGRMDEVKAAREAITGRIDFMLFIWIGLDWIGLKMRSLTYQNPLSLVLHEDFPAEGEGRESASSREFIDQSGKFRRANFNGAVRLG